MSFIDTILATLTESPEGVFLEEVHGTACEGRW